MLGYSVSYFLGDYWNKVPLYAEKLVPLLDYLLTNNNVNSDKLSKSFYALMNKYQNTADLPQEDLEEYVRENGYGYIFDLLNPNSDNLKIIVYLLVLIHQLKGNIEGIKLVLSLFQLETEPEDTEIIQWYEELPVAEENTFKINSKANIAEAGDNFFTNFSTFIKNYVYPELRELRIRYEVNAIKIYKPYTKIKIKYTSVGNMGS